MAAYKRAIDSALAMMVRFAVEGDTMPHTVTSTVYTFSELSDSAKDKARDWLRTLESEDFDAECVLEDAATIADLLGISLKTRTVKLMGGDTRQEPVIQYSGFSSQGDGACFEGTYAYRKGSIAAVRAHAPVDAELHRIAGELAKVQRRHFYRLEASLTHRGRYVHEHSVTIEVSDSADTYRDLHGDDETIADLLRDYMRWIYRQLEREYGYRLSNASIDASMQANGYGFDEDGRRV